MYYLNDKEEVNRFKNYLQENYTYEEALAYYLLYMKTLTDLDIEQLLINKLEPSYINNAYGFYNSEVLFVMQEKKDKHMEVLDNIVNKVFNKKMSDFCTLFYKKTDVGFDVNVNGTNSTDLYNKLLKKELNLYYPKFIINFSTISIKENFHNTKVYNLGYSFLMEFSHLSLNENPSDSEKYQLNNYKMEFWKILKIIKQTIK